MKVLFSFLQQKQTCCWSSWIARLNGRVLLGREVTNVKWAESGTGPNFFICTSQVCLKSLCFRKRVFLIHLFLASVVPRRPTLWQEWQALTCAVCWGSAWPPPCSWSPSWCRTAACLNTSGRTRIASVPSCSLIGVSRLLRSVIKMQVLFLSPQLQNMIDNHLSFDIWFEASLNILWTQMWCVFVGHELSGGSPLGAQRFSCSQCPGEESKPREDHRLRTGPSARYRRDWISCWRREGEMTPRVWKHLHGL